MFLPSFHSTSIVPLAYHHPHMNINLEIIDFLTRPRFLYHICLEQFQGLVLNYPFICCQCMFQSGEIGTC